MLGALGYSVMRFNWDEVMGKNEDYQIINLVNKLVKVKLEEYEKNQKESG